LWLRKTNIDTQLLESNGMEVFTQYFRRAVSQNAPAIFDGREPDHGSFKLLQQEMNKVASDADQASKIAETIDSFKDDIYKDFDLAKFSSFFFSSDPISQILLIIAFTRCTRPDLRNKADKVLSDISVPCIHSLYESRTQLQNYHPKNVAAVIEYIALMPTPPTPDQKNDLFWAIGTRFDGQGTEFPPDIMSALLLLRTSSENQKVAKSLFRSGSRGTSSKQAVEDVLHGIGLNNINDAEIANAMLFMVLARSQVYDIITFVTTVKSKSNNVSVDWMLVLNAFDMGGLQMQPEMFLQLFKAFRLVALDDNDFDLQKLWGGQWQNPPTQIQFVRSFLLSPTEEVGPSQIPNFRPSLSTEDLAILPEASRQHLEGLLNTQYASTDALTAVFEVILNQDLSPEDLDKTDVLNEIYQNHPVIFILSLTKLKNKPWTPMQEKFVHECFRQFIEKQRPDSQIVLEALYTISPQFTFDLCAIVFQQDPRETEFVYQRAEEFGWTLEFLKHWSNPLALDMACMRNKINPEFDLEKYLTDVAEGRGHTQLGMILCKYVRIKADDEYRVQREQSLPQSVPLSLATVHTLLEKLEELTDDRDLVESAQTTCLQTYPRLMNYGAGFDEVLEKSSEERGNKLPEDIDRQMSELFGRMYRAELSIRDMVTEMKNLKTSSNPNDQDLFCCIVHGLFDEYVCYSEYPEDALEKTALLFGNIIKFKLLPSIPRDYGLVLILRAVRDNQQESLMWRFGIEALLQISDQLPEWPGLCSLLLRIPSLRHPEIIQRAQEGLQNQQADGEANGDGAVPHTNGDTFDFGKVDHGRAFRSVHADPPPHNIRFQEPDRGAQEKVLFVINNLSKDNMSAKIGEVKASLSPENYQWFASYLVEQRAKLEPNNQEMYYQFVSLLEDGFLTSEIIRETYVSILKLMNAESTVVNSTDRTQLKNLGGWLGSLTLAQDKPIKHKNIYFVDLLIEGHETQRLVMVIPFTCRVLTQGTKSMIFKPPNPWLMEIVGVLKELYEFTDLKLNQKFEIEVLCKELKLDIKKIEPATLVRDRSQPDDEITNVSALPDGLENFDDLSLNGAMNRGVRERLSAADIMATLPNLAEVLKYPPPSGTPQEQTLIRDIIYRAFDQAIQEIIAPVVERSITIASISTAQLIAKDYALNSDPEQYQAAARQMVKSLAGSLALVTCKEPLRMSITNWIRRPHDDIQEPIMPEGAILMCVNDNLDTACSFVETAAVERAIPEIDIVIAQEIEERRRFLSEANGRDFISTSANSTVNRWSTWIPEPYKQSLGGLNESQRAVYEDFARRVHGTNISHTQNVSTDSTGRQIPDVLQDTLAMPNLSTPADQHAIPHQSPLAPHDARAIANSSQPRVNGVNDNIPPHDRIALLVEDLQKAAKASEAKRLKDIEKDSSIFQDFRQILIVITSSTRPTADLLARQIAEKICNIFATKPPGNPLEAEVLAFLLSKLCQLSELIIRDVLRWMTNNEQILLSNVNVVAALVIVGLMDFSRVDSHLADALNQRQPQGLQILSELMDQTLFLDEPQALRADYANSLVAMSSWLKDEPSLQPAIDVNSRLRAHGMSELVTVAISDKAKAKQDQMRYILDEWVGIFENRPHDASTTGAFLRDVHQGQVINSTEDIADFLRIAVDACIETFEREASSNRGSVDNAFMPTDALARLLIVFVVYQGETNGAVQLSKAAYLETILSLLVLIVNHHQVMHGVHFHQRVFHRLFSVMLYEYSALKLHETPEHDQMIQNFGTTLVSLQPVWFPNSTFAWMGLILNRVLVTGLLNSGNAKGHSIYRELIGLSLSYFSDSVRTGVPQPVLVDMFRGIFRNLLVLHHDFPEFLCTNYTYLCSRVAYEVPQLRNLILTSRPVAYQDLPDPMTPGLKIERLEEMKQSPELAADFDAILTMENLAEPLESALKKGSDSDAVIKQLISSLQESNKPATVASPLKSIEILNALVPFVGQSASANGAKFDPNGAHAVFLTKLAYALSFEHRYYLASALTDQVRFPNTHTDFFCKLLLNMWGSGTVTDQQRELREPLCRAIYERLAVQRPHPWGLTILAVELQQNTSLGFWDVVSQENGMHQRMQHAVRQVSQ
jgi:CCR4-NOT transcription complex subunit 1